MFADRKTGEVFQEGWDEWARINAFTAHLCMAGQQPPGCTLGKRTEHFGFRTMQSTLEPPPPDDGWTEDLRPVARWLSIDGEAMYTDPLWGGLKQEDIENPGTPSLLQRWEMWKTELQRIVQDGAANANSIGATKEALQSMARAELKASSKTGQWQLRSSGS